MNRLKLFVVAFFLGCFFDYFPLSAQSQTTFVESKEDKAKRMSWWTQDRFGMFLHWGLYSQTAGDWKGKPTKGGEHFMLYERIPVTEYAKIADDFNPVKYNADHWVKVARDAGMKYIVITAKHHDGFAMYSSASSDYNIVKKTPYAKDPMKDLAVACKKYGLKLCFYYSLGRDWEDPDVPTNWPVKAGRSNTWDYPNEDAKVLSKYFERKVKPQVKELLTQYGPIGIIWFDTPEMITRQESIELKQMIHDLQPNCIVNSRIGNGQGDFLVSEQEIINKANVNPWESCVTISSNWGYNKHDTAWKSPEVLVRQLVEVVSKGGNYLLNIGPRGDGSFPIEAEQRLAVVGKWMKINSEGIYGTQAWKLSAEHIIEAEHKEGTVSNAMKDVVNDATSKNTMPEIRFIAKGNELFVAVCSWKDPRVLIKTLNLKDYTIKSVRLLGYAGKLDWQQNDEGLNLTMPEQLVKEIPVYLFKLNIASR